MEILTIALAVILVSVAFIHVVVTTRKSVNEQYVWRVKHGTDSIWLWLIAFAMLVPAITYILEG